MTAIKRGTKVMVIAGDHKGKIGKVLNLVGDRVVVEGVNMHKKCLKKSQNNPKGGIIEIELSIHRSNVALLKNDTQAESAGKKSNASESNKPAKKATKQTKSSK